MPASIATFIRELIRAANEVEQLTAFECARLLRRSAATIRDYREQAGIQQAGAEDSDIVKALDSMGATIDRHGPGEVGGMILEAVAAIKAGRADLKWSLDAEYMQLIDELNKPRGATEPSQPWIKFPGPGVRSQVYRASAKIDPADLSTPLSPGR